MNRIRQSPNSFFLKRSRFIVGIFGLPLRLFLGWWWLFTFHLFFITVFFLCLILVLVCWFYGKISFLTTLLGRCFCWVMLVRYLYLWLIMSRLLIVFYWSLVFRFIFFRLYYFLKFFIDAYNCIIRMIILSIKALIILRSRLNLKSSFLYNLIAECF